MSIWGDEEPRWKRRTAAAHSCEMLDVSAGGAALHLGNAALYFWVDQQVTLDKRPAHVLRHFPGGIVVKFDEPMEGDPALSFSRN